MKKMNFEQMEVVNGGRIDAGWTWSLEEHLLCGIGGALAGGGFGGAAMYLLCLQLLTTR